MKIHWPFLGCCDASKWLHSPVADTIVKIFLSTRKALSILRRFIEIYGEKLPIVINQSMTVGMGKHYFFAWEYWSKKLESIAREHEIKKAGTTFTGNRLYYIRDTDTDRYTFFSILFLSFLLFIKCNVVCVSPVKVCLYFIHIHKDVFV